MKSGENTPRSGSGVIQVVVVDRATGRPVPGAQVGVFLIREAKDSADAFSRHAVLLEGIADERGTCVLPVALEPGEEVEVQPVVRARGYEEWRAPQLRHDGEECPAAPRLSGAGVVGVEVSMERGATIRGLVTDAAGRPVAGARIGLVLSMPHGCSWPHAFGVTSALHWPPPCRTDERGGFDWLSFPIGFANEVSQGRFVLLVEHDSFVPAMVQGVEALPKDASGVISVAPVLEEGCLLEGTVLGPDGAPAIEATVTARAQPTANQPACVTFQRRTSTDSSGRWTLRGLRRTVHRLEVGMSGCSPVEKSIDLTSGGVDPLWARLGKGTDIEGRVVQCDGSPVAGAPVFAKVLRSWHEAILRRPILMRSATTGEDGSFRLSGFPGACQVEVRSPPSITMRVKLPSPPITLGAPPSTDLSVLLTAAESGKPLGPPAYSTVLGPGFSTILEADEQGICQRSGMPVGSYRLIANAPDCRAVQARLVLREGGPVTPFVIPIPKGRAILGTVRDASGVPVAGARIVAYGRHFGHERRAESDGSGAFEVRGLGYLSCVVFSAKGHAVRARTIWWTGSSTSPARHDMVLQRGATVSGRVVRGDGSPVARTLVRMHFPGRRWVPFELPSTLTDDEGRFTLQHVPKGRLLVAAGSTHESIRTRDGGEVRVELRAEGGQV